MRYAFGIPQFLILWMIYEYLCTEFVYNNISEIQKMVQYNGLTDQSFASLAEEINGHLWSKIYGTILTVRIKNNSTDAIAKRKVY